MSMCIYPMVFTPYLCSQGKRKAPSFPEPVIPICLTVVNRSLIGVSAA